MPEITLPEIHLRDVKLPDGLRDMNRQDIANAIGNVKADLKKLEMPDIDLSKVELPKAIEDRLPNRKRSNKLMPLLGLAAVGSMIAAAWYLITSPTAGTKIRETADRLWTKATGRTTDLGRYDDEQDLGSLLQNQDPAFETPSALGDTWSETMDDLGNGTPVGPGRTEETTPAH